jgi:1-deoxy-D-xylulose-5-phosphate reductoisomerase
LTPILNAIDAGSNVALANKEPLVMAGELIMERARAKGVKVLPVDSEHSAIFQCLHGHDPDEIHKVYLTASGGPFYRTPRSELQDVTPAQATKHPTWDMGPKISVDSATLMNKGLELIEAMHLFDRPMDSFEIVIHPQSIVHGLVEFTDGGILAHMGVTDMKLPIQFALTWPERVKYAIAKLNLATMGALTFAAPDFSEFPCLGLAMDAARLGGTAPAVLNGGNEEAVAAFCQARIPFTRIPEIVEATLRSADAPKDATLKNVLAADADARRKANEKIDAAGVKIS